MALVTVQRSPTPSSGSPDPSISSEDGSCQSPTRFRSFSESFFTVKGAAIVLPRSECVRHITASSASGSSIQSHLQEMLYLLRPQDTIKIAVKLESKSPDHVRYFVVVSCVGRQDTIESIIVGIDCESHVASIGLVLPVWADATVTLDGDGGFSIGSASRVNIFKPVSIQAMWSALQSLHRVIDTARCCNYFPGGLTHTWISYYEAKVASSQEEVNEWHAMPDVEVCRTDKFLFTGESAEDSDEDVKKKLIRAKLKEIMMTVDLEECTSKYLRTCLEEVLGLKLTDLRSFVDNEMINILRQMDAATPILDFLYLGSEWNASNLDELRQNNVGYILNVTREIDNFFPGYFQYFNVRVYDDENADLLKSWNHTFDFIQKAKDAGSKVLVHCKMGISRSASTVIAYIMKSHKWDLEKSWSFVKERRSCIRPNSSFQKQLKTYEGILDASRHRDNALWRSTDDSTLGGSGGGGGGAIVGFRTEDDADIAPSSTEDDVFMRSFSHPTEQEGLLPSISIPPPFQDSTTLRVVDGSTLDAVGSKTASPESSCRQRPVIAADALNPDAGPPVAPSQRPRSWSPDNAANGAVIRSSSPQAAPRIAKAPAKTSLVPARLRTLPATVAESATKDVFLNIGGAVVDSSQTDPHFDARDDGEQPPQDGPANLPSLSTIRSELRKLHDARTHLREHVQSQGCAQACVSSTAGSGAVMCRAIPRKDSWSSSSSGGTGGSHEELNMLEDSLMGVTGLTPRADSGYTSANANDEPAPAGDAGALSEMDPGKCRFQGTPVDEAEESETPRGRSELLRPNSIYDAEDIPWTPGTVRKTTKHYEARTTTKVEDAAVLTAESQPFPVQRSKSLRLEKPRACESSLKRANSYEGGDRCGVHRCCQSDVSCGDGSGGDDDGVHERREGLSKDGDRSLRPDNGNATTAASNVEAPASASHGSLRLSSNDEETTATPPIPTSPPPEIPSTLLPTASPGVLLPSSPHINDGSRTTAPLERGSAEEIEITSSSSQAVDAKLSEDLHPVAYRIKGDLIPLQMGKVRRHTQEIERLKTTEASVETEATITMTAPPADDGGASSDAAKTWPTSPSSSAGGGALKASHKENKDDDNKKTRSSSSKTEEVCGDGGGGGGGDVVGGLGRRGGGKEEDDRDSFQRNSLRASLVSAASAKMAAAAAVAASQPNASSSQSLFQSHPSSPPPPQPPPPPPNPQQNRKTSTPSTPPLSVPPASATPVTSCSSSGGGGGVVVGARSKEPAPQSVLSQSAPTGKSGFLLANYDADEVKNVDAGSAGEGGGGGGGEGEGISKDDASRVSKTSSANKRPREVGGVLPGPSSSAASGDHRSPVDESPPDVNEAFASKTAPATREFTGVRRLVGEFERKRHTVGSFTVGAEEGDSSRTLTTVSCPPENLEVLLEDPVGVRVPTDVSSFNIFRFRRNKNGQSPSKSSQRQRMNSEAAATPSAADGDVAASQRSVTGASSSSATAASNVNSSGVRSKNLTLSLPANKAKTARAFNNMDPAFYHTM